MPFTPEDFPALQKYTPDLGEVKDLLALLPGSAAELAEKRDQTLVDFERVECIQAAEKLLQDPAARAAIEKERDLPAGTIYKMCWEMTQRLFELTTEPGSRGGTIYTQDDNFGSGMLVLHGKQVENEK
jgi:hypothetical protein